ncbi:2-oxo acid dehydrogenase subunit E2 [Pseudonocardia sp. TRM90224]|uniref:2-oxo acid dehydrogenase subunit E2 n=1 Tax=Pseudonocardia sp. TRM90224 TaxID=2812678 RepID=UPI001E2FEB45|nr:2-oxo acid dehydrogenase subunit E2 [Pseudonocardia sp. TRM90224]
MADITIPKLNTNDSEYVIAGWLAEDGAEVAPGEAVVMVETSKAVEDVVSEDGGVLRRLLPAGATCLPGQVIGRIGDPGSEPVAAEREPAEAGPTITAPARELMDAHGITEEQVGALGIALIRRADVEALLHVGPPARTLTPVRRGMAATVTRSWQTIPAAFTAVTVEVGPALDRAKRLTRELRTLVGLPELLIQAIGRAHGEFPEMFAELDGQEIRPRDPHVGITIDLGSGLYTPVVRDAGTRTLAEISAAAMRLRMTAMRGTFTTDDLAGSTILLALNTDTDAVVAVPIVFPGHACAVSLCAPRPELALAEDGTVVQRTVATLGLAYDHRLVTGRDALRFLAALRSALEAETPS